MQTLPFKITWGKQSLPMNKVYLIRNQLGLDWSKGIVEDATIDDLDPQAIQYARQLFAKRQGDRKKAVEVLETLTDIEVLNKAGITFKGKITRTALLLLGKSESAFFFGVIYQPLLFYCLILIINLKKESKAKTVKTSSPKQINKASIDNKGSLKTKATTAPITKVYPSVTRLFWSPKATFKTLCKKQSPAQQ